MHGSCGPSPTLPCSNCRYQITSELASFFCRQQDFSIAVSACFNHAHALNQLPCYTLLPRRKRCTVANPFTWSWRMDLKTSEGCSHLWCFTLDCDFDNVHQKAHSCFNSTFDIRIVVDWEKTDSNTSRPATIELSAQLTWRHDVLRSFPSRRHTPPKWRLAGSNDGGSVCQEERWFIQPRQQNRPNKPSCR